MLRQFSAIFLSFWTACCSSALADEYTDQKIAESALRETRDTIARELFGHYDITELEVLKIEDLRGRISLKRDYGLVKVTLKFSAIRNATRDPSLNPNLFEPGQCWGWLYLHCGVPLGHVFEGKLEVLLAVERDGSWRVVSPHWRSRRQYSLDGYLLLEGREKEGYVLFPQTTGALTTRSTGARRRRASGLLERSVEKNMARNPLLNQFGDLSAADFAKHPVWASVHTLDYDEPWYVIRNHEG